MKLQFTTVDVFTSERFIGNPVAIVNLPKDPHHALTQSQKQKIAREFNLSETVFVHPSEASAATIKIDIFTSIAEINFAGHPTIGTASYLLKQHPCLKSLRARAGAIPISTSSEGITSALVPHNVRLHRQTISHPLSVSRGASPVFSIVRGMAFVLLHLPSLAELSQITKNIWHDTYSPTVLDPDFNEGILGTYAYVLLDVVDGVQEIRSRMHGSREDPSTGSGSSALCCYLALQQEERVCEFRLMQGVEMGRKGVIEIRVTKTEDERGIEEVRLSGRTVEVMEGLIQV